MKKKTNSKPLNGAHQKIKHAKRSSIRVEMQGFGAQTLQTAACTHDTPMNICINLLLGNRKGEEEQKERERKSELGKQKQREREIVRGKKRQGKRVN